MSSHLAQLGSARSCIGFRKPIINPDVMIGALYIFSVIVQIPMVTELNVNRSLLVDYSPSMTDECEAQKPVSCGVYR